MTPKRLIKICRRKEQYETPELNDALYLNHEGFSSIKNLEPYINVKSLFLDGNMISKIENISHLKGLRGLYLRKNQIERISNLEDLEDLNSLDLSGNGIKRIEGIRHLHKLETLNLENNKIYRAEDLEEIVHNKAISTLNLSGNMVKSPEEGLKLINLLSALPNLKALYLKGNGFVNTMDWYRKQTVSTIRTLTFLDDRPIFENERRLNDAWKRGGRAEEEAERKKINFEKAEKKRLTRKIRRQKYEARRDAMFARLARERKEAEEQSEVTSVGTMDETSEDSKNWEFLDEEDSVSMSFDAISMESKTESASMSFEHVEANQEEAEEVQPQLPGSVYNYTNYVDPELD